MQLLMLWLFLSVMQVSNFPPTPCVAQDNNVPLPTLDDYALDSMTAYLNAGGTLDALQANLSNYELHGLPQIIQLEAADITGDNIPEVFLAVTNSYFETGYEGETFLHMYVCEEGVYTSWTLFRRAGAGIRAYGLYAGGGAQVLHIGDINNNGLNDVLFASLWEFDNITTQDYIEYYLFDYDPESGKLIELFAPATDYRAYTNVIGEDHEGWAIEDLENDDAQEIIIDERVYRWDGEYYTFNKILTTKMKNG